MKTGWVLVLGLLAVGPVSAEDAVVVVPAATIRAKPQAKAECVTQVPLGDTVHVVKHSGAWLEVSVPNQYRLADGYPGWVLKSETGPVTTSSSKTVEVTVPRVILQTNPVGRSVGTAYMASQLQTTGKTQGNWVQVNVPGTHAVAWVAAASVSPRPLAATGDDMVRMAKTLSRTHYLWGGISVDGIDCSGLTYMVYRAHGIILPRDADQQFLVGEPVEKADLQPGDLVFYGKAKDTITHVAIYAGAGQMVEASSKSNAVMVSSIDRRPDFQGGRRVIGVPLTMPPPSP